MHSTAAKNLFFILATSTCFMTNNLVESVRCGKWYSTACLADIDKRYDTSYTNYIKEQNSLWADQEGIWIAESRVYNSSDLPAQPMMFDPTNLASGFGLPYTREKRTEFVNITMSGSRYYEHRYIVFEPAPQGFCDEPIVPPAKNALSGGTCGVNGYAAWAELYATTSHEKVNAKAFLRGFLINWFSGQC